jgi:hypothetical protein
MATMQRVGDLEVSQDLDFQRRSWTFQRVGWVVVALLVLAALLGLFGSGPLSQGTVGAQGGPLWVEYPRFARLKAPTTLRLPLGPEAVSGSEVRIWLDRTFLEGVQIQQVTPQPDRVEIGPDRFIYVFQVSDPSQPTAVVFFMQPEETGSLSGRTGLDEGPALSSNSFIYP